MNYSANLSTNVSLCDIAQYLSTNRTLQCMLISRLILAAFGIVFFIVIFKIQGTYLSFHPNARLLLLCHNAFSVLQSFSSLLQHLFNLIRYSIFHQDPCDYLLSATSSVLIRTPGAIAFYGEIWTLTAIAVERVVATIGYRKYEATKSIVLGKALVLIQGILTLLSFLYIIHDLDWAEPKVHPTLTSDRTSHNNTISLSFLAVIETVTLSVFYVLLVINRLKKKHLQNASLSEKYQVAENIRSLGLLIPIIWTHFVCFIPTLVAFPIYFATHPNLPLREYPIFMETFNISTLYSTVLPLVLFWQHKALRQNLRKVLRPNAVSLRDTRAEQPTPEQARHFEMLAEAWN